MKRNILLKCLLVTPVVVLFITMFFLNSTVQYLKSTAFTFVYNTNVQSVEQFSKELTELAAYGYSVDEYGPFYASMIQVYNKTLGEKEAIVTFLMDRKGNAYHSSDHNKAYLSDILADKENMNHIRNALKSRSYGEMTMKRGEEEEKMYYHTLYSGENHFTLFMCTERDAVYTPINTNGIAIPIGVIGFLLLITIEYAVWLSLVCVPERVKGNEMEEENAN